MLLKELRDLFKEPEMAADGVELIFRRTCPCYAQVINQGADIGNGCRRRPRRMFAHHGDEFTQQRKMCLQFLGFAVKLNGPGQVAAVF